MMAEEGEGYIPNIPVCRVKSHKYKAAQMSNVI